MYFKNIVPKLIFRKFPINLSFFGPRETSCSLTPYYSIEHTGMMLYELFLFKNHKIFIEIPGSALRRRVVNFVLGEKEGGGWVVLAAV